MKHYIGLLGLILIIAFTNTNAQQLFVDGNYTGSETTGAESTPYKTIADAVNAASEGDEVIIKAGTYREQVEIATDSITIKNYGNDKVVVSGTEPVLEWESIGNEVHYALVPWDITENDESNQVFVDGEMIHLVRWPKQVNKDFVTDPNVALVDDAENSGSKSVIIKDAEFTEPKNRWLNSMVWVNLANNHDGQGWTGEVSFISESTKSLKLSPTGSGIHAEDGHNPWAVQTGTEYYLFNPTSQGVYSTGGPEAILARGEWWKNGDTLFVRMPDGKAPASNPEKPNLVEAKKRLWAFIPAGSDNMHHVTIKGLHIFASSITTDRQYYGVNLAVNSHHNVIDSITAKYVTHFIDQSGHYQSQWYGRSGIILSGVENTIKNSIIQYGAGAAVSAFGERHKILNNRIYEVNYQVTEAGALNSGNTVRLYDPEIAYNLFYNIPQKTINIGKIRSSNPDVPGLIRIHHNVIMNFMLRNNDSGAMNASAGRNWDLMRIDHNVIANANKFLAIGIYTDYGGQAIIDHNLIWNVDRPIQMNRYSEDHPAPIGSSDDGPMGEIWVYNNTVIADSWNKPGIQNNHVNGSGEGMHYKNNIISNKINATLELAEVDSNLYIQKSDIENLFVDYENFNFQLSSSATQAIDVGIDASPYNDTIVNDIPDIGAFEFGAEPWTAGPEGVVTNIKITDDVVRVMQKDTVQFSATAFTSGFIQMEPQPQFYWYADGSGRIDQNGLYVADSADTDARVYVTTDSLLWAHVEFKVYQLQTGIDDLAINPYDGNHGKMTFSMYPNPANDKVHITLDKGTLSSEQVIIKVFDSMGRVCSNIQIDPVKSDEITLHTNRLEKGIYLIKMFSKDASGTGKLIID